MADGAPRPTGDPAAGDLARVRAIVSATPPVVLDRIRGRAPWRRALRTAWPPLTLLVAAALTPLLYVGFASSAGWPGGGVWPELLAGMAAGAALTLAGYFAVVKGRPRLAVGGSPCAAVSGFFPLLAGMALAATTLPGAEAPPASGWMALGLVALGLGNRVTGALACAPSPGRSS